MRFVHKPSTEVKPKHHKINTSHCPCIAITQKSQCSLSCFACVYTKNNTKSERKCHPDVKSWLKKSSCFSGSFTSTPQPTAVDKASSRSKPMDLHSEDWHSLTLCQALLIYQSKSRSNLNPNVFFQKNLPQVYYTTSSYICFCDPMPNECYSNEDSSVSSEQHSAAVAFTQIVPVLARNTSKVMSLRAS